MVTLVSLLGSEDFVIIFPCYYISLGKFIPDADGIIVFYKQVGFSNRSTVKLAENKRTALTLILSHSFHCM